MTTTERIGPEPGTIGLPHEWSATGLSPTSAVGTTVSDFQVIFGRNSLSSVRLAVKCRCSANLTTCFPVEDVHDRSSWGYHVPAAHDHHQER